MIPPTVAGFGSGVSMPPCGFTASSHGFQHELGRTQEGTGRVWACKDHVEIAGVGKCAIEIHFQEFKHQFQGFVGYH